MAANTLMTSLKFFGRVSTMGSKKVVIYVPEAFHKDVLKNYKGKNIRVTLEDAE
jgi:hypothetical protein